MKAMAKRGRKFTFHGAYGSKAGAARKERKVSGGFILKRRIRGSVRYIVMGKKR